MQTNLQSDASRNDELLAGFHWLMAATGALGWLVAVAACSPESDGARSLADSPADTGVDAGTDASTDIQADGSEDGPACLRSPTRIQCDDRAESAINARWSAQPSTTTLRASNASRFGEASVQVNAPESNWARVTWSPETPTDLTTTGDQPPVLRVAVHADNPNHYGWRSGIPEVIIHDADGDTLTLRTSAGNREFLPTDHPGWRWLHVPLSGADGWRLSAAGNAISEVNLTRVTRVALYVQTWGSGFSLSLDGLAFTDPDQRCHYDCGGGCNGRGECAPSELRCACQFGAVGPQCGSCGQGFAEGPDGDCVRQQTGEFDEWPNNVSDTTGDAWLRANHQSVEVLRPKVMVLNFANDSESSNVQDLVDHITGGFELASTPKGFANPDATPQLQYDVAKHVDLRNGHADNPDAPADWSRENSTLFPRRGDNNQQFDYAALFSESFAKHYGYEDPDGSGYLTLCELIESGRIHDVWMVAAHTDNDATPAEVLEFKQRYTPRGNPVPGSFEPCAGNGCFRKQVSPCARSVRIGFINYRRGPGCYLHNIGHLMEWTNSHNPVPGFRRWFNTFAGMNLDERYDVPFQSFYEVSCSDQPCITYPDASSVKVTHEGQTYTLEEWKPVCGNTHFPPNAQSHYNYDNTTSVRTSCASFAEAPVCDEDSAAAITQQTWKDYRQQVPDCGGGFLVWWYQNMPARGTQHAFANGEPMKSVWPHHFY